jgi:RimJ/RimL family protein N-acetyltransferase
METEVSLLAVTELDVDEFFAQSQARGEAHPSDYASFLTRWRRNRDDPNVQARTIIVAGTIVGYVAHFTSDGLPEVSYELGPEYWGKGFATAALRQFVVQVDARPLYARAAENNTRSTRVLQKCGFVAIGEDRFVAADGNEVEEFIFALAEG